MKTLLLSCLFLLALLSGWVLGFSSALLLASPRPRSGDVASPRPAVCTCAPCLPDLWCHKCGHKSRDCPKLSWYFRRLPNVKTNENIGASK